MIESDYVFMKPLQLPDAEARVSCGGSGGTATRQAGRKELPICLPPVCISGHWLQCVNFVIACSMSGQLLQMRCGTFCRRAALKADCC